MQCLWRGAHGERSQSPAGEHSNKYTGLNITLYLHVKLDTRGKVPAPALKCDQHAVEQRKYSHSPFPAPVRILRRAVTYGAVAVMSPFSGTPFAVRSRETERTPMMIHQNIAYSSIRDVIAKRLPPTSLCRCRPGSVHSGIIHPRRAEGEEYIHQCSICADLHTLDSWTVANTTPNPEFYWFASCTHPLPNAFQSHPDPLDHLP